ncbi:MAG: GGDEF domain-containing protein [Rhodobacteraceae bacterium]|nr:GGDEF domain-containing protein [Paracoccaceae bacterium]
MIDSDSPMPGHYDTIFYLIRQTIGARHVTIQLDGEPRPLADDHMACLESPLVSQGRQFGMLRAYAEQFESGASHLLAGFAVLVAEQHALWAEAHLDVLTKVLTRRAFMSDLGRAAATFQRSGRPCSLIMFDLDHFKKINDTHGHAAGDAVLRAVAHVVQSELRRCDILGRVGGEEFAVLIMADHMTALEIAERLRAVIEATVVRDFRQVGFTASLGVATMDATTDTRDALIALADARLYAAKEGGRNRVQGDDDMPDLAELQAAE